MTERDGIFVLTGDPSSIPCWETIPHAAKIQKKKTPENLRGPRSEVNPETRSLKLLVFLKNEESEEISNIIMKIVTGNSLP